MDGPTAWVRSHITERPQRALPDQALILAVPDGPCSPAGVMGSVVGAAPAATPHEQLVPTPDDRPLDPVQGPRSRV